MSIYTGGGDRGKTSLLSGERVPKTHIFVEAYGTLDELTAQLGVCRALIRKHKRIAAFADMILEIQRDLFRAGMQLSSSEENWENLAHPVTEADVASLEGVIDALEQAAGMPTFFVSPGRTFLGASLHLARTICRRAERRAIVAADGAEHYRTLLRYLNRLSDLLFSLSWCLETQLLIQWELNHGNPA